MVARKIESLRVEQPRTKVLFWDNVKKLVREEVNRLLSEKQLSYIFRCLANAGVVSFKVLSVIVYSNVVKQM